MSFTRTPCTISLNEALYCINLNWFTHIWLKCKFSVTCEGVNKVWQNTNLKICLVIYLKCLGMKHLDIFKKILELEAALKDPVVM